MKFALKPLAFACLLAASAPALAATPTLTATPVPCSGNVLLGTVDSTVADRNVNGACINDLIIDTPNHWGNHGQFVSHVSQVTLNLQRQRALAARERSLIMQAAARSGVGATLLLRVLGINDFHGAVLGPTGTFDGIQVGGAEFVAGHVRALRAAAPHSLFVSSGDLVGATPLVSALFFDEPTIEVMNAMGLDINAVGNHEFDKGKDEALRLQHGGCHPTQGCLDGNGFDGASFQSLAANVIDQTTGKTLFPPYKVFNFKGNKVAIVGAVLEGTPSIVTPTGVAGLQFLDEAASINALIPELRQQGVRTIIALIHEGGTENPATAANYNDCNNLRGPILPIVAALDGEVDLVMTGHTHQAYICQLPNASGQPVPVTGAAFNGRFITQADLTIDTRSGNVAAVTAVNVPTYRHAHMAQADVRAIVDRYDVLSAPLRNRVIGQHSANLTRSANAAGESFLGNLIADAQLHATRQPGFGAAVVAFMNPGGIRADLPFNASGTEGNGNITYGEAFGVQPFGNSLVTMTLTGRQIEILLEQQFTGCNAANAPAEFNYPAGDTGQPFNRILQVSRGFTYTWNNAGPACNRIDPANIRINGVPIDLNAAYRITVNSFLAEGGDKFFVLPLGTHRLGGAQDLDALEAYLQHFGLVNPSTYPEAQTRIQRIN